MGSVWDPGEEDTSRSFCSSRTPNPWWSGCLPPSLCCKRLASFGWLPKSIYRRLRINDMHQTGFESGVGPCLGTGALAKGLRRLESGDCPRKHPRVSALLRGSGHRCRMWRQCQDEKEKEMTTRTTATTTLEQAQFSIGQSSYPSAERLRKNKAGMSQTNPGRVLGGFGSQLNGRGNANITFGSNFRNGMFVTP